MRRSRAGGPGACGNSGPRSQQPPSAPAMKRQMHWPGFDQNSASGAVRKPRRESSKRRGFPRRGNRPDFPEEVGGYIARIN
jgi:hypothetical protein